MTTPTKWKTTIASALCMGVGMSAVFMGSFPVFLAPVSAELGWGRATFPQIITIVSITGAILMPFSGRLIDRVGVHRPVAAGLALVATGMLLLSMLHGTGVIFWAAALCLGAGAALAGPPAYVGLVASWHDQHRALAIGLVLSIAPASSQAIVAPLTQHVIADFGWRLAFRVLAAAILVIGLIASLGFLRSRVQSGPEHGPTGASGATAREAYASPAFWLLALSCLATATLIGITAHLVAWLTGRGVPAESAAFVLSALFLAGMAGAFLSGYVADRTRSIQILQIFYALPLLGLAILASVTSLPALLLGAAMIGVGTSATTGLAPYLVTRYFGIRSSAEIFGLLLAMTLVGIGVAPVLIGIGFDRTGSYALPITLCCVTIAIATLALSFLDRASRHHRWLIPHGVSTLAGEPVA